MSAGGDRLRVVVREGQATPNGRGEVSECDRVPFFPRTDAGNAERLVYWHGQNLLYCGPWGAWVVWDGKRWMVDEVEATGQLALDAIRRVRSVEVLQTDDPDIAAALTKHSYASEADARVRAAMSRARGLLAARPAEFDADEMRLNCPNGILDLRTGAVVPHDRAARMTKVTRVPYKSDARCPLWLSFLDRVMDGRERLIDFLQRVAGYLLTGLTVEDVLIFLYGSGRNGKSVFIWLLRHVLGEYARSTRPEVLMVRPNGSDNSTEIAALVGARFVSTTEVEEGQRLAESLVKQLTGGDTVTARRLYSHPFDFRPTFKIVMAGNHRPTIRGGDPAIWERILTVPFIVTIPAAERDKGLRQKLEREAAGILAWMVEGCRIWQERGLDPPEEVRAATEEYRSEMDTLGQFLADCCELEYTASETAGVLYDRYSEWCKANGVRQPGSSNAFGRKLREHGFEPARLNRLRVWQGIRLVNSPGGEP